MQRVPRKLQYLKCNQCRKDRQKCTPVDRHWPTRRCDRCIKFEYACSESMTAGQASERELSTSQGKQPIQPDDNPGEQDGSRANPIHVSDSPSSKNTVTLDAMYASYFPDNIPIGIQPRPKCAGLFRAVNIAYRLVQAQKISSGTQHGPDIDTAFDYTMKLRLQIDLAELFLLQLELQSRKAIVMLNKVHTKQVAANIADGLDQNKAKKLSITKLIDTIDQGNENLSVTDFIVDVTHRVREGERWQQLIDAVGSQEIWLIGLRRDGDLDTDDDDSDDDDSDDDIQSVWDLEKRFRRNYNCINFGKITKMGSDEVFAKMLELLLAPDLQLKEACHRLSGLSHMIGRHLELSQNSVDTEDYDLTPSLTSGEGRNKASDLNSFLSSEIDRRLQEVLGEQGPNHNGEEIPIKDHNSGATSDIIDSDEHKDVDEDFCINFQNSKAFDSVNWA